MFAIQVVQMYCVYRHVHFQPSEKLMFAIQVVQMYCVYLHVHCHHIQECLYPWHDGRRSRAAYLIEIQDLECRMRLERIANGIPRFLAHHNGTITTQMSFNTAFVFSYGVRNFKNLSVTILNVARKL
jgi:hypothetical protein